VHAAQAFQGARHFDAVESLIGALDQAPPCNAVVVKGSRFMQMERVVAALLASGSTSGGAHAA
jgi:UDP-N-acetylmuramyl pentapeptide synthase